MEMWKLIDGFPGYEISSACRIRSLPHKRILKQSNHIKGYMTIGLRKNRESSSRLVHRLFAIAFVPNPENKPFINHKNGNKKDNTIENLEWCTGKENSIHASLNGMLHPWLKGKLNHHLSKPIIQLSISGKELRRWPSLAEAQRQLGVSDKAVSNCLRGLCKTSCGFIWKRIA